MRCNLKASSLKKALGVARRHTNPRSPLAILGYFKVSAADQLLITATDVDSGVTLTVEAEIEEPGEVCVPAKLLGSLVAKLKGTITLALRPERMVLLVIRGEDQFELPTLPAEDFPNVQHEEEGDRVTLPRLALKEALGKVLHSVSSMAGETRNIFRGVNFTGADNRLTLMATDGRRISVSFSDVEISNEFQVCLSGQVMAGLASVLEGDGDVELFVSRRQVVFKMPGYWLHTLPIEGRPVNWRKVVLEHEEANYRITIPVDELEAAIERCLVFAVEEKSPNFIRISIDGDRMEVSSNSPGFGSGRASIPVAMEVRYDAPTPVVMGVNGRYLLDALSSINSAELVWWVKSPIHNTLIEPGDSSELFQYALALVKLRQYVEPE